MCLVTRTPLTLLIISLFYYYKSPKTIKFILLDKLDNILHLIKTSLNKNNNN